MFVGTSLGSVERSFERPIDDMKVETSYFFHCFEKSSADISPVKPDAGTGHVAVLDNEMYLDDTLVQHVPMQSRLEYFLVHLFAHQSYNFSKDH